ncbi:MAG: DUF4870 domain-containing protein [Planctomycetota bacterium]|jgi:uncharacterized Tic20 family protein
MGIAEEIEKLNKLRQDGTLSEDEFRKAKESILSQDQPAPGHFYETPGSSTLDVNVWSMYIHLAQFCGYIVPVFGLVVPIVLWQLKKGESEVIDKHGKIVLNWILSALIYGFVSSLLVLAIIGILMWMVLGVLLIVFPIIGGIKANSGEVWPYPLSINFCRVE